LDNVKSAKLKVKKYVFVRENSLTNPKIKKFLIERTDSFHREISANLLIFTASFIDEEMTPPDAWKLIKLREERIINLLKQRPDVIYILSTTEMENSSRRISNPYQIKHLFCSDSTKCFQELVRVFSERDHQLSINPTNDSIEIMSRALLFYVETCEHFQLKDYMKYMIDFMKTNKLLFLPPLDLIYYICYELSQRVGMIPLDERNLQNFPILRIAITYQSSIERNQIEEELMKIIYSAFRDVKGENHEGRIGSCPDFSSLSKKIGYILKNCRHESVYKLLQRSPTRLINIHDNPIVNQFFEQLCDETPAIIDEIC
jgi:hypothetical protein